MNPRPIWIASLAAATLCAVTSCAQRSRSTAPPPETLAVGDVPGATTVPTREAVRRLETGNTIVPIPAPGEDSAAAAQRKIMNVPKFGDYVFVTELPEAIERPKPEYPASARGTGVSGIVMVQALVLADGTVGDTRIVKSIPPLDAAAASCVRKWKFKPALNKEGPTAVWVGVPVKFDAE